MNGCKFEYSDCKGITMKSYRNCRLKPLFLFMILTAALLVSCQKISPQGEARNENADHSNSAEPNEQLNGDLNEDEEMSVIVNGIRVNLGEITLEELIQKCGLTSDYTVKNEGVDNPKARYALKTELIGEGNNIRIYAEIEREEKETDLKNQTVCGLSIERSEPVKTDTVSVDGVCIGDSMDDVNKAFGSPDITCPFADGYGKNCRFRKGKMYDLTVDLYQGEVSRIEIHRLTTDELTLFESFKSKWDESDQTKNMTIKSLSLRVPCNSIFINNSVMIGDSVKCRISREDREYTAENKTDEADLYRECFVELTDSLYGTNVEYEKGYVDGNPAVYFNHKYKDEEDGKEYYRSGVVFVTDYYMYWCTYTTLAEDENNRSAAGKILSSIKAEEPLLERISSLFTNS